MTLDEKYMRLAIGLAKRGLGKTSPNPMVGAVVVNKKRIVGQGYHHRAGEPHAEVLALQEAGASARGATLYLNLEPCNHFGKTPPCTRAILETGIKRVVVGMKDPNPLVEGRGIRRLRKAGIRVEVGTMEKECQALNAPFRKFITTRRPFVILKIAVSLDGKVATRSGDSRWITSEVSRRYVHHLRKNSDAVMVGIGTVLQDDPLLTVRIPGFKRPRHPLRVIVDSSLRIPLNSQLVGTADEYPTLVATTEAAASSRIRQLAKAKVEVVVVRKNARGQVNLKALMEKLAKRGVTSILLEGGPTLNAGALREGLVDRVLFFFAPKIIGGVKAPSAVGGEGVLKIMDAKVIKILRTRRMGSDLLIEGSLETKQILNCPSSLDKRCKQR
jgi:diaminohydroxyphosphoribosylaminopyrimidine deaminase/5-amino-6-(5-phosphoribosylamino)uracil reductase